MLEQLKEIKKRAKQLLRGDVKGLESLISETRRTIPSDNQYWFDIHTGLEHTERFAKDKKDFTSNLETFISDLDEIIERLEIDNQ